MIEQMFFDDVMFFIRRYLNQKKEGEKQGIAYFRSIRN